MNDNLFYDPSDLDIGDILKEEADRLIETLDLPEIQEPESEAHKDDLLDTIIIDSSNQFEGNEPSEKQQEDQQTLNVQLPTPSLTPSIKPANMHVNMSADMPANVPLSS